MSLESKAIAIAMDGNQPASQYRDPRKNVEINIGKACNNRCVFCIDGLPKAEAGRAACCAGQCVGRFGDAVVAATVAVIFQHVENVSSAQQGGHVSGVGGAHHTLP